MAEACYPIPVRESVAQYIGCRKILNEYACAKCGCAVLRTKSGSARSLMCNRCSRQTHGMWKDPRYRVWVDMKRRATNSSHSASRHYNQRGIGICEEWMSFEGFSAWSGFGEYSSGLQIERIDNNLGYSPGNCRWATVTEQQQNKRTNKMTPSGARAVRMLSWSGLKPGQIAKIFGISVQSVWSIVAYKSWQNV